MANDEARSVVGVRLFDVLLGKQHLRLSIRAGERRSLTLYRSGERDHCFQHIRKDANSSIDDNERTIPTMTTTTKCFHCAAIVSKCL
eukprot:scaffold8186_cov90-Alexandrium_tamarense.AAC.1